MQAMEQASIEQMQMQQAQMGAQPQPMEGGGMEQGQQVPLDMQVQGQVKEFDPIQTITDIIFQALNTKPGQSKLGNVQQKQQGEQQTDMPSQGMPGGM